MAFVTEKEELKPGLILFRRGDVDHRMRRSGSHRRRSAILRGP